jgi:predicted dehydrogenase
MENVKILLIGCGYWGKNWYKTIKNSKFLLAGVVDPSPLIEVAADELYDSLEEVNVTYTHAILAVNANLHSDIIKKLNIPQENILVEKPCGVSLEDAKLIKDTFPGYIFLYSDEYQYIKNNINKIGKPLFWKSIRASMGPRVRADVSILEDYMIHDIYLYLDLFGNCNLVNKTFTNEFNSPIKDSSLHLELNGTIPGYFYSSWHYPIKERKIIIVGDKGSFIWENDDLYYDNTHYINDKVIEGTREKIQSTIQSNLDIELEYFILNNKPDINILDVWSLITNINKN